jgi:hypothetical protein
LTDHGLNDKVRSYTVSSPNTTTPVPTTTAPTTAAPTTAAPIDPDGIEIVYPMVVTTSVPLLGQRWLDVNTQLNGINAQEYGGRFSIVAMRSDTVQDQVFRPNRITIVYDPDSNMVTRLSGPIRVELIPTTMAPTTMAPTTQAPTTMAPTTPAATCPDIQEGETVLNGETGALYRVQGGALRQYPDMDIYRSWGSPSYRALRGPDLDQCPRGPPLEAKVTEAPTTQAPEPETQPAFDPTLYLMIHKATYDLEGKLHVLAARFGSLTLEPYRQRERAQVFLTNSQGMIRSASGQGEYVEHNDACLAPVLTKTPDEDSTWAFQPTGTNQYAYRIVSACGSPLHAEAGKTTVDLTIAGDGVQWYVLPVGTASF